MNREEKHYRNVAALPCARCGIHGYSQAAHSNLGRHGKGGALKADYRATFPLCCTRPGVLGCHAEHDQYVGMSYEEGVERTAKYLAWTEEQLRARGQWPEDEPEKVKVSKHARQAVGLKPEKARTKNKSRVPVGAGRGFPTNVKRNAVQSRILPQAIDKESAQREKKAYVWPKRELKSANRLGGRK